MKRRFFNLLVAVLIVGSCGRGHGPSVENHSYAQPQDVAVTHLHLDLRVDFDVQRLAGTASLDIENESGTDRLILDTWALVIKSVKLGGADGPETPWELGDSLPLIGRPLVVDIADDTRRVAIEYETGADARGVQWLSRGQTMGRRHPALYTQSQAILARSWVPCQDTPAVRFTYSARVRTPPDVIALMSARNPKERNDTGVYDFRMPQPIPSYLLALAVGDFEYRPVSNRCGVYAEPDLVDDALWEFIDMERMTRAAEELYGPYRWEQFDVLVLPPSFPFGGMENPRLTFATPVLIAGDRSLTGTIAHELAHSWSGNLVTNATWSDFWLNEGFTTYFERRIMEALYGREISEMDALRGRERFEDDVEELGEESLDTALYIPLEGRDPDEELGWAAYEKGYLFLRMLEEAFGREAFDAFLREYFDDHAFETMTSARFIGYLTENLLGGSEEKAEELGIEEWVYSPGLPENAPLPESTRLDHAARQAAAFVAGTPASRLETTDWTSHEWKYFIQSLISPLTIAKMDDLAQTFRFANANAEVQRWWYMVVIENEYRADYDAMEGLLLTVGRRWLIRPIYEKLAETEDGRAFARDVYRRARPGYHAVTRTTIDGILGWDGSTQ